MKTFKFVMIFCLLLACVSFAQENYNVMPYILKAPADVVIDGKLDEWNYCFPFDLNSHTITENDNRGWTPIPSDDDIHGTVKFMWDDENLYVGALIVDDVPGVCPFIGTDNMWNGDVFEILIGNYDIGSFPSVHSEFIDSEDGKTDYQFTIAYTAEGAKFVRSWYNPTFDGLDTDDNMAVTIEGNIAVIELKIPYDEIPLSTNGNRFQMPAIGSVVPIHVQIYDVDEIDSEGNPTDFTLWGYGLRSPFPWGSQIWPLGAKIVDNVLDQQNKSYTSYENPFCRKAPSEVIIDGKLDEWNYCFPFDINSYSITAGDNRGWGSIPADSDIHGTIRTMWDDENFYISAELIDDNPGVGPFIGTENMWNGDVFEVLMGNYGIDEVPSVHEEFIDTEDGKVDIQFTIAYTAEGAKFVKCWYNPDFDGLDTDENMGVTIEGNKAIIELKIPFAEIPASSQGNHLSIPEPGTVIPFHLQIYDVDELDSEGNPTDFTLWGYGLQNPFPWGSKEWPLGLYISNLDDGLSTIPATDVEENRTVKSKTTSFLRNYPNPFNPNTTISFNLTESQNVSLNIYNIAGQKIKEVISCEKLAAGSHQVNWDGRNSNNQQVPSGIYFYRLETDDEVRMNKMTLLK